MSGKYGTGPNLVISTCKLHLHWISTMHSDTFEFFGRCWSKCNVTSGTLAVLAIVCWQSEADCTESKSDQICEMHLIKLSFAVKQVVIVSFYTVRIKGCYVACDECVNGEISSFQPIWVTGSVMWGAASGESQKFGVQGVSPTNRFSWLNR